MPLSRQSSYSLAAFVPLIAWALPLAFVAAIPLPGQEWRAERRTAISLTRITTVMQHFKSQYRETPRSLNELRAFAQLQALPFPAYDAYGARFDYLRLDDNDYFMRSFGDDGAQNTVKTRPDISLVSWGERQFSAVPSTFMEDGGPAMFPSHFLAGAESPNHDWVAKIYMEPSTVARRLVAHSRKKPKFFMVAPNEMIEEFFWLPSGYQIVYSASSSARNTGGIFLWNILDDTTEAIAIRFAEDKSAQSAVLPTSAADDEGGIYSLASVQPVAGKIFVHCLSHAGLARNPAEFFRPPQSLTPNGKGTPTLDCRESQPTDVHPVYINLKPACSDSEGSVLQQQFCLLPTSGSINTVVAAWQGFLGRFPESSMVPHTVFAVAVLYADAYRAILPVNPGDAEVLRALGAEFAKRLGELPMAPRYLQVLGQYVYSDLMAQRLPTIRAVDFPPPMAVTPAPQEKPPKPKR